MNTKIVLRKIVSCIFGIVVLTGMVTALSFDTTLYFNTSADNPDKVKYSEVRIFAANTSDFEKMTKAGLFIDHANSKPGHFLDAWLSEYEISRLQLSGVSYQILVDDWEAHYNNQPKMTQAEIDQQMNDAKIKDNVTHSIYGTMGGYLKYSEVVAKLDSMRMEYPDLISQKFSIGQTHEGREMWAVRVTKNPDAPTGRPEVFYNALIHAREPESMQTQVYYFYWLFENYGTDPIATYILNTREIYWLPVLNVDGYVHNQTTNPNGGGMWRCNRHGSGSCGWVDLNRNFGVYEFWNSPNKGSEEDSCVGGQSTYRGRSPFSEIETQNFMNFVNSRNFKSVFNAHTFGNYLLKPWDWIDPTPTPHDHMFNQYLADMSASSNYVPGTTSTVLGYFVRGGADDWIYEDSAHGGYTIGITPETGTSFWPAQSNIIPFAQNMLYSNQYMSMIAGPFVNPVLKKFDQQVYSAGQSGNLKVVFRNKGQQAASNVSISLTPVSANLSIPVQQYSYSAMNVFQTDSSVFNFSIGAGVAENTALEVMLKIKMDTSTVHFEKLYVLVGNGVVILNDNAEGTFSNWTASPTTSWAITTTASHSPTHSFTDSPNLYPNNANISMTLANAVNITNAPVIFIDFFHKYDTEQGYDFCNVEVSSNNGTNWQTVKTFTGESPDWTNENFDLTTFANASSQMKIRFRLTSDGFKNADGWYVDDVKLYNYNVGPVGIPGNNVSPASFSLEQNYPNPFNPSTVIKYNIPNSAHVSIKVFDILGNEVAQVVNEKKNPGSYEVEFNGANLSSGVYFYKITAGSFTDVKRMMMIK